MRRRSRQHPLTRSGRVLTVAALACAVLAAPAAAVTVEFPGPVAAGFAGSVLSGATVPDADGRDRLVAGTATGEVRMVEYNAGTVSFSTVARLVLQGEVVALLPVRDAGGAVSELLAATRNPDGVVTLRVGSAVPYLEAGERLDLEEDPGGLALGGPGFAVVTLPGVDRLVWLVRAEGRWVRGGEADTGDRPGIAVAADLEGDGTAEIVLANAGALSRSAMVFRREGAGVVLDRDLPLPAAPSGLAAGDVDGDGRDELAVAGADTAAFWLLADDGAGLAVTGGAALTVAADGMHLAPLPGGRWALFPSSSSRGLVEYYRNDGGPWLRQDGYYPGCRPLGALTGDLNGDGLPDVVSLGGATELATVMFGGPQLTYWGFPALALPGRPGGLSLGDFDGDGRQDVAVMAAESGTLAFFRSRADGGVEISPEVTELFLVPGAIAAVEADAGPGPELAVHDRLAGRVRVLARGGEGWSVLASAPLAGDARRLAAADVDGDGRQDLVAVASTAPEIRVLFGAGDGTFPETAAFGFESRAVEAVAVDLDADGDRDLVGVDAVNRVWIARNDGGRGFVFASWLNAGSGARTLALGDLDDDGDEDVVVVGRDDEILTLLENTGAGTLDRRVGSLALEGPPAGALVTDVNQDGTADVVVNLRDDGVVAVVYGLPGWSFTPPASFAAGGDVAFFAADDFNADLVPDLLTLDASLQLGLTLLNVERGLVPAAQPALEAACADGTLAVTLRPDREADWRLELADAGGTRPLADARGAREGRLAGGGGLWTWTGEAPAAGTATLRLETGGAVHAVTVGACGAAPGAVGFAREPWPNPFNPVVQARLLLARPTRLTAAVYDLRGRLVATLREGVLPAGEHVLRWDGTRGGRPAEAGVYLLRVAGDQGVVSRKVMLLK